MTNYDIDDLRELTRLRIEYWSFHWDIEERYKWASSRDGLYPDTVRLTFSFPDILHPADAIAPRLTGLRIENARGLPRIPRAIFLPILRHCPNLEELTMGFPLGLDISARNGLDDWVQGLDWENDETVGFDTKRVELVILPRLRSLTYTCDEGPYPNVLTHLRVPSLKQLHFAGPFWHKRHRNGTGDICEMINESSARIEVHCST